jgi:hypothetical protein
MHKIQNKSAVELQIYVWIIDISVIKICFDQFNKIRRYSNLFINKQSFQGLQRFSKQKQLYYLNKSVTGNTLR